MTTDLGGIRTIDDIRDRCHVDEDTGCWQWKGARGGATGAGHSQPMAWFPPTRRVETLAGMTAWFKTGARPPRGVVWVVKCGTRHCANPAHRKPGTLGDAMRLAGIERLPLQNARCRATKRARSHITEAVIAEIVATDGWLLEVAKKHGIATSTAYRIRKAGGRPIAAPGSSIFNLGSTCR